jgi:hypothetical protein
VAWDAVPEPMVEYIDPNFYIWITAANTAFSRASNPLSLVGSNIGISKYFTKKGQKTFSRARKVKTATEIISKN